MGLECGAKSENRGTLSNTIAVVLAAGKGSRMNTAVQKQYLELLGRPVITYTLDAFEASQVDGIVLVVGEGEIAFAKEQIVEKYGYKKVMRIVTGGKERYDSVYKGLCAAADLHLTPETAKENTSDEKSDVQKETYVLIQDGARAFIRTEKVNFCIHEVKKYKACVMGMPVKDTIKIVDKDCYAISTPDRATMWLIQTPQCFVLSEIKEAYRKMFEAGESRVTDDAMVMEQFGCRKIKMIEGGYDNIKITTPDDFIMGEAILKRNVENRKQEQRSG